MRFTHVPVLENEVLKSFEDLSLSIFVDGTVGLANHAKAILNAHPEIEKYIGIDQDEEALKIAKESLTQWKDKTKLYHDNFANLDQILQKEKIDQVNGFLFDLGTSSMQLDDPQRGFSFGKIGPLDMRMDRSNKMRAENVVNEFSEKELEKIFKEFGEEPFSKQIAKAIVEERKKKRIDNTKELADLIARIKGFRKKIHPATLVFQALRIYVNQEMILLEKGLKKAIEKLGIGKMIVISFHSLEDRIVKDLFKVFCKKKHVNPYRSKEILPLYVCKKPIGPTIEEIRKNPRSRSAKMRVIEKHA